jgi:hypothetical protein
LAQPKIRAGLGAGAPLVQEIGLGARHGRPQPRHFKGGSIELRLSPDNGGLGDGTSRQRTDQFALLGAGVVQVMPRGARRLVHLSLRAANQAGLNDDGFQRPLLAAAAQSGQALQRDIGGHSTISRICRRVSSIVDLAVLG